MASTFSKLNSEIRRGDKEGRSDEDEGDAVDGGKLPMAGQKRSRKEKDLIEDERQAAERKEREEIRRLLRMEQVRTQRRERAGLNKTKNERDQDRDISEKIALGQA